MVAARRQATARVVSLLVALMLSACGDAAPTSTGEDGGGDPQGDWVLTGGTVNGQEVPIPDEPITLTIDGSTIGGRVCNTFGGRVTSFGGMVEIVDMGQTMAACVDEDVMTAETLVVTGIGSARTITVEEGDLVIRGPDVELRYVRAGARAPG